MRDISAERRIERRLVTRFDIDNSRIDVTVMDREATISGALVSRSRHEDFRPEQLKAVKRYFSSDRIEGVDRYYFQIHNVPGVF